MGPDFLLQIDIDRAMNLARKGNYIMHVTPKRPNSSICTQDERVYIPR
jgi:hypothetical protein